MVIAEIVDEFRAFVGAVEPSLRRALGGHRPAADVLDALGEAFAHAWEHWDEVRVMANPAGFLFRVAQSRSRSRRAGFAVRPAADELPDVEPALVAAMRELPPRQRSALWLVHGCGWPVVEAADAMGITPSAVSTHLSRGLASLRERLGVQVND